MLHVFQKVESTVFLRHTDFFIFLIIIIFFFFAICLYKNECSTLKKLRDYQNIDVIYDRNILFFIKILTNELCQPVTYLIVSAQTLKDATFKIKIWETLMSQK